MKNHFNLEANKWDTPEKIEWSKKYATRINELIPPSLNTRSILDFGCGTGLLSYSIAKDSDSIFGIDTSDGMIQAFNTKSNGRADRRAIHWEIKNDDSNPELKNSLNKFDLIVSAKAFHHLVEPKIELSILSKFLKNNGKIVVIDLDKEDGTFHPDPSSMGVHHFGFKKSNVEDWLIDSDLKMDHYEIVNEIHKNDKVYLVFLAIFA